MMESGVGSACGVLSFWHDNRIGEYAGLKFLMELVYQNLGLTTVFYVFFTFKQLTGWVVIYSAAIKV